MGVFHRWYFVFNLSKLWEIVQDRGAWHVAVLRSWRSDTTEQLNKSSKVSGCLFAVTSAAIDDHRLYPLNCWFQNVIFRFHQFSSVTQLCPTLWDPMNHSTPGLPVHHQLPEFTQTHPSSQWCHPAISSSVISFSSHPQSLPASESFPMSQLFAWGGQRIGVSSALVLPTNTQDWSPLEWTGWISLPSKGLSRVFSNTTVQKHQFFGAQLSSQSNSHIHTWPLEKP